MSDSLDAIRQRLAQLEKARVELDEEEHDLLIAERVLARLEAMSSFGFKDVTVQGNSIGASTSTRRPPTQTEFIVATMRLSPEPWFESTNVLHETIKAIHGIDMKKSSFQPLMSQLFREGVVTRDGYKVALAERVKGGAEKDQAAE